MHLSEATAVLTTLKGSPVLVPVQSAMTVLLPPASAGPKPVSHRAFPPVVTIQCTRPAPLCADGVRGRLWHQHELTPGAPRAAWLLCLDQRSTRTC